MRHTEDESPDVVLARLYANEPKFTPHPKTGRHPAAAGRSDRNESREDYERRHAAWEQAVAREKARKKAEA